MTVLPRDDISFPDDANRDREEIRSGAGCYRDPIGDGTAAGHSNLHDDHPDSPPIMDEPFEPVWALGLSAQVLAERLTAAAAGLVADPRCGFAGFGAGVAPPPAKRKGARPGRRSRAPRMSGGESASRNNQARRLDGGLDAGTGTREEAVRRGVEDHGAANAATRIDPAVVAAVDLAAVDAAGVLASFSPEDLAAAALVGAAAAAGVLGLPTGGAACNDAGTEAGAAPGAFDGPHGDHLRRGAAGGDIPPSGPSAAAALLSGIRVAQQLINHFQAVLQQWIAAFARPGVAVPLEQLVDVCQHPGAHVPGALRPPDERPHNLPTGPAGQVDLRPLLNHPRWALPLADTAARLAAAELGCALNIAPLTARIRTERALAAVDALPATWHAQHAGHIDGYRADIIADRTVVLPEPLRRRVERTLAMFAAARTPATLRHLADREVTAADPSAAARRAHAARAGRGVYVDADRDDMATFRALLAAPDAHLAFDVLDQIAADLKTTGCAHGRGSAQLRADAFTDLIHTLAATGHAHITTTPPGTGGEPGTGVRSAGGGTGVGSSGLAGGDRPPPTFVDFAVPGRFSGVTPCPAGWPPARHPTGRLGQIVGRGARVGLNVYMDATTLACLNDAPAELEGHGAITADTARAIAASAATIRTIITRPPGRPPPRIGLNGAHPSETDGRAGTGVQSVGVHSANPARNQVCGTVLDAGRAVYRPPDPAADYATARDRRCQWPGCRAPASRCDLDHRHPYHDDGATCPCNTDLLCRTNHRAKTFTAWTAKPGPDGLLLWTSPTGHTYPKEPTHLLHDHAADHRLAGHGLANGPPPGPPHDPDDELPPF